LFDITNRKRKNRQTSNGKVVLAAVLLDEGDRIGDLDELFASIGLFVAV